RLDQELRPESATRHSAHGQEVFHLPGRRQQPGLRGGPIQYEAYLNVHPDDQDRMARAAADASAFRTKQNKTMSEATGRDVSDPLFGSGYAWSDFFGG